MRQPLTARNTVIDTGGLTLFFTGDPRVRTFFVDIERGRTRGYVTSVTLSEFYYKTCQKMGEEVAKLWYHQCMELLRILETSSELSLMAGKEKCHRSGANLSLADCFVLAAAKSLNGTLVTTYHELAKIKEIQVKFIEV